MSSTAQSCSPKPDYFFDLKFCEHAVLFKDCAFVWEALKNIKNYLEARSLGKIEVEIPSGAHLVNPELISIGKGCVVEPGAYIQGPCILGKNCTIRHGAYIRGGLVAGDGCVIGHGTEVKNSIFLNKAHAAHFAYVGDSILGYEVNLGAGTVCANLKLDRSEVVVCIDQKLIPTGLHKFGAIIGDQTQIGCNAVINPGTLLGKEVFCYPCINVGGFVPSHHQIKVVQKKEISKRK